ncbi:MAG: hypothetical protein E7612_06990 [Ruminococcaceae bacterium]|nr:hypothetical protein [Oscillospiraceae bacterium]
MKKRKNKIIYGLIVFCLILLFNPNINVIDPLPDFIAWFLLARIFESAADSAPHFEEARANFIRLGWINLLKIPAFLLIMFVKSKDTLDNNIYALVSLSFAVFELILTTQAVKYLFTALFYLGERTEASSLIKPFKSGRSTVSTPEALRNFTYLFFIVKTLLYVIPDLFLLTRVSDKGYVIAGSSFYPYALLLSIIIAAALGAIWLFKTKKYVCSVYEENLFSSALIKIGEENGIKAIPQRARMRILLSALTVLCVASFFSLEFKLDTWNEINVLPHFIYGLILLIVCHMLYKYISRSLYTYISGAAFCIFSLVHFISTVSFLTVYEYKDILTSASAQASYNFVQISSLCEFLCLSVFLILMARNINEFIENHTGTSPDSDRYQKLEIEFHRSLKIKNYIMTALGILAGATKCADVFLNSEVQILFSETNAIITSALPWFGTVVTVSAIAYIIFTFFFTSSLKDEVKMKYQSL